MVVSCILCWLVLQSRLEASDVTARGLLDILRVDRSSVRWVLSCDRKVECWTGRKNCVWLRHTVCATTPLLSSVLYTPLKVTLNKNMIQIAFLGKTFSTFQKWPCCILLTCFIAKKLTAFLQWTDGLSLCYLIKKFCCTSRGWMLNFLKTTSSEDVITRLT